MKYEIIKGSEKDFEGAPEWALFRDKSNVAEYFSSGLDEGCLFIEVGDGLAEPMEFAGKYPNTKIIAERRPITEPVWDGEGLPPVGIMCEISNHGKEFYPTTIVAITEEYLITKSAVEQHYNLKNIRFRPIRSPDDVARDEAIEVMRDVGYTLPAAIRFTKEEMAALYEAGYRKME